jgi:uncharacterized OB-fold protein
MGGQVSGLSFSNRVDNYRAESKRRNRNTTLDAINHKYMRCPRCKKSMPRDEYCPTCGWSGKEGFDERRRKA